MVDNHLDMSAMQELKMVMEDEFQLLIDTFVTDSRMRIDHLAQAIASADPEALRKAAHSFKGSSSNIGAPRLAEFCKVLEEAGRDRQLQNVVAQFAAVKDEYAVVERLLRDV